MAIHCWRHGVVLLAVLALVQFWHPLVGVLATLSGAQLAIGISWSRGWWPRARPQPAGGPAGVGIVGGPVGAVGLISTRARQPA